MNKTYNPLITDGKPKYSSSLDKIMEDCIKEKRPDIMLNLLGMTSEEQYAKFDYYMDKMISMRMEMRYGKDWINRFLPK